MTAAAVDIVRTVEELRSRVISWRLEALSVGLIPTMGALHAGHLSLVEAALKKYDRVIATLFVNPRQFDRPEDLAKYPRTEDDDATKLASANAHLLYAPNVDEIYPSGYSTNISVSGVSSGLCGGDRPGHFDGVATVCTKLFLQSGADGAFFGEKDFQQLRVVQQFVRDLNIPILIHPCPTVREDDGLALSSRNKHLSDEMRTRAPVLHQRLRAAAEQLLNGVPVDIVMKESKDFILKSGFDRVDYFELRDAENLELLKQNSLNSRLFVAAWLGKVRLIDNIAVIPSQLSC
ncbi:MAG: pantoate--beta-alanine ligase [Alphaproteobacteria bacterium]